MSRPLNQSYPFSVYSGLLTPVHYEKIGNAIWLFLWCISSTTKEIKRDGMTWGIVLGNKPLKAAELALQFGVNEKTIRRWLALLERNGYIAVTRAPYGMILSVRHSKKFAYASHVRTELPDRTEETGRADKLVQSNKDITQINTKHNMSSIKTIAERFAALRSLQEGKPVHPSSKDYQAIARIVARGVSLPQTIKWLEQCFEEYETRRRSRHETIKVFSYCEKYIIGRLAETEAKTTVRRENNAQKNNRRGHGRTKEQEPSITGGQTGRIRRKTV
ncbi:phage portal protein [Bacillus haynesii]|uniref:phage portal protein n=1 Tax=Bacillus haynesii TaxID=1925021 RepID=UPI0015F6436A|nr:phage portal protein [Bacillus haynesii]MCY8399549.1 helix-turn-helix domain-containing protein [Bacillus haynesii]MCY8614021.1 helix-turn-helix domain-containing protein [Bacillus haynesii]MCY8649939.1 helix-turn-helix domain-containing protein [Bacillus haynesii]MCY9411592.1 helix-turn-helix domain-containing protein [Bacillus haynesii]MEC1504985.1 phage portal protein [Bacillus haynesii]